VTDSVTICDGLGHVRHNFVTDKCDGCRSQHSFVTEFRHKFRHNLVKEKKIRRILDISAYIAW